MTALDQNPSKRVAVTWLGGRPLVAGRYSTVARFPDDFDWPNGETWSVVLNISAEETTASFLMSAAPHARLFKGNTFELFEGVRHSASVTVLE